jgi:integrase/recombinase XerD
MTEHGAMDAEVLLDAWSRSMLAAGRTVGVVKAWPQIVRRAARDTGCPPNGFTTAALAGWLDGFISPSTRRVYRAVLRYWHGWLIEQGHLAECPVPSGVRLEVQAARKPTHELLSTWGTWMRAGGMSGRTVKHYSGVVRQAARASNCDPTAFTADALAAWLSRFEVPATLAAYSRALRAWHRWLFAEGHRIEDPMARMRRPRDPRGVPRPVSTAALDRLIAHTSGRVRVMVLLAAYQGLRVHEIAKIRGEDFDLDDAALTVIGKGGKHASLPLHPAVAAVAKAMPVRGWWFPSPIRPGRPVRGQSVTIAIGTAMRECEVRGTAHCLRHWFGTNLLRAGADVRVVQTLMRHSSLATTERYLAVNDEFRVAAVLRLPSAREPSIMELPQGVLPASVTGRPDERIEGPTWPGEHAVGVSSGYAYCSECGPLTDEEAWVQVTGGPRILLCPRWEAPRARAEQLAALDCPPWCDQVHGVDTSTMEVDDRIHYRDLGLGLGLILDPDGRQGVHIHFADGDLEMTPAHARMIAAELLNAADVAEVA